MKKFTFAVTAFVAAWQLAATVNASEQTRGTRKGDHGVSGRVIPMRDAGGPQEAAASSLAEVAERAENKLVNHAESIADGASPALAAIPANDDCANSAAIAGQGTFNFDNAMATLDGGAHGTCTDPLDPVGTIDHDVWYCWTSPCTGPVVIQTCNQTTVDTKLAVYDGCTCPATSANVLGCNDDGCGTGSFVQSRRTFLAETGQSYLIRLGTYPGDIGDPGNPNDDIPVAPGGVGSFSLTCLNLPCAQASANCQEIKANAGSLSNQVNSIVADNFKPTANGTITNVCWWGSYGSDIPPAADSFRIRYFTNNASNLPGVPIGVIFQQPGNLTVTGPVETVVFGAGFPIFEYSATHAGIPVTAGQTYWVEISNNLAGADNWYWQQGFGDDQMSLQDGSKPAPQTGEPIDGYTVGDRISSDMAFCAGVPIVLPPPTSPCLTAQNTCCAASQTSERGCENRTCCEAVCMCDPYCCTVNWDINCATVSMLDPDCGAQVVCPGVCAGCPEGTISFTNPDECTVDAREPHAMNNNTVAKGITQLAFTGPAGADNESCWTITAPNSVQNIVDNGGGNFTMTLSQPTAAFAVTQIRYVSDSSAEQTAEFISHPGNVNGSAMTDTADVFSLRSCCLNPGCTPVHGIHSCDLNHSGTATAEDLSRLMDLLNGGNDFSLWNQTQIPASDCP